MLHCSRDKKKVFSQRHRKRSVGSSKLPSGSAEKTPPDQSMDQTLGGKTEEKIKKGIKSPRAKKRKGIKRDDVPGEWGRRKYLLCSGDSWKPTRAMGKRSLFFRVQREKLKIKGRRKKDVRAKGTDAYSHRHVVRHFTKDLSQNTNGERSPLPHVR